LDQEYKTSGLIFGGFIPPGGSRSTATEEYDGTSFTTGGSLSAATSNLAGCGTQTSSLAFGGSTGSITAVTQEYNGSSWTSVASLATARSGLGGAGVTTAALAFGGSDAVGQVSNTEEYSGPNLAVKTITTS
jgi:hypothetical protein